MTLLGGHDSPLEGVTSKKKHPSPKKGGHIFPEFARVEIEISSFFWLSEFVKSKNGTSFNAYGYVSNMHPALSTH